jgi:F-type H+-transporting ATPase subunit b
MAGTDCILAAGGGSLTDVSVWTMLWSLVAFFATLLALSRMAWPMLAAKMEEREKRIREGLDKAEEAEKRAQELLEKQEVVLAAAREEATQLIADGRDAANRLKNETVEAAQAEISKERERAKKEIEVERKRAIGELREAAVDLTLDAAGRVLERSLTDEDHRRLASEVIGEVEGLKK